jgi:hypothetical protein
MMKPLNSENATAGAEFGVSVPMPGVPGDGLVPEAARRPLWFWFLSRNLT